SSSPRYRRISHQLHLTISVMPAFSPACALDRPALFLEKCHDRDDVVALHLDHAILDGATATASGLELLAQLAECRLVQWHALDKGHTLAFAPLGLARYPHDAVRWGQVHLLAAHALRHRLAAFRAGATQLGGVNQPAAGWLRFHGLQ